MSDLYDGLPEAMQNSVDALLAHAATALWPERRAALESFHAGIAKSDEQDLREILASLGIDLPDGHSATEIVYRVLLTTYLQRLGEPDINNPDQAYLFGQSLAPHHVEATRRWLVENPEYGSP